MDLLISEFYSDLFCTLGNDDEEIISVIQPTISNDHNEFLEAQFTLEEVQKALFSMHLDKSLGPDGFNLGFFQAHWETVKWDVSDAFINFLHNGGEMPGKNQTTIVLIPKKAVIEQVTDLWPISLCNVVDRIVCKMLANCLKNILSYVISNVHSAFIPNRLITDNKIVAYECFHVM